MRNPGSIPGIPQYARVYFLRDDRLIARFVNQDYRIVCRVDRSFFGTIRKIGITEKVFSYSSIADKVRRLRAGRIRTHDHRERSRLGEVLISRLQGKVFSEETDAIGR